MELDPVLLEESMQALRVDKSRRRPPHVDSAHAADRAVLFNLVCPVGTIVRYFPIWGQWDKSQTCTVSRRAYLSASKEPVVFLDDVSGCVSVWNCEPVTIQPAGQAEESRGAA